ncbi:Ubinuclein-2 [Clonorchis sinensis]|uniref:Ubinuclein-2 n=1 Tax=Clonorchis sinensis TaxID=79923 RepID=A0A8T1MCB2_CLOSI|nr:Ubinuclein-2 [Clonorchis sinensis]
MSGTTVVFDINITNTEERREWSYLELVENHLLKNADDKVASDPFSETDMLEQRRLVDLAKSLERKYGTMVTMKKSGKRKRIRIDDFLDPGEGYDTQDSFIDDSEAVDVYVAPNVSTKHGGFFVYEGALEGLEDESIEIEAPVGAKPSNSSMISRPVAMKNKSKELLEKAVKRLSASKQSAAAQRRKLANLDSVFDAVLSCSENCSPGKRSATAAAAAESPVKTVPNAVLESLPLNTNNNNNKVKNAPIGVTESSKQPSPSPPPSPQQQQQQQQQPNVSPPPPLPASLSSDVTNSVANLIKLGSSGGGNQRRVMSKPFEAELLGLAAALAAANVAPSVRSTVFAHVEGVLQWKRKSLTRRLKKLNEANEDQKMNPSLDALGDAIARAMPPLLESYVRDKELHAERVKVWQAENAEQNDTAPATADGAAPPKRNPKPGPPKKLFRWNVECRHLFESVVTLRLQSYHTLNLKGPREEYLRNLFPTLIQLWPDGWITNAALWRAALPVFQKFTATHPSPIVNNSSGKHSTPTTSAPPTPNVPSLSPVPSINGSVRNGLSIPKTKSPQSASNPSSAQHAVSPVPVSMSNTRPPVTCSPCTTAVPIVAPSREPIFQQLQGKQTPTVCLTDVAPSLKSTQTQDALRTMLNSKVAPHTPTRTDTDSVQHVRLSSPPAIQSSVHVSITPTIIKNKPTPTFAHNVRGPLLVQNMATTSGQRTPTVAASVATSVHVLHSGQVQATFSNQLAKNESGATPISTVAFRLPSINSLYVNSNVPQHSLGVGMSSPTSVGSQLSPAYSQQQRRYTEPRPPPKQFVRTPPMPLPTTVQGLLINPTSQPPKRTFAAPTTSDAVDITGKQSTTYQQLVNQSSTVALSSSQIDQLQQRALVSSTRSSPSANTATLPAAGTILLPRQPPPAHQQTATTQAYHQRLSVQFATFAPTAHAGLFITDVKTNDQRLVNPSKKE